MKKHPPSRPLYLVPLAAALALGPIGAAMAESDLRAGAVWRSAGGMGSCAEAGIGLETLGDLLSARLYTGAAAELGLPGGEESGRANARAELSLSRGAFVALAGVSGGLASGPAFDEPEGPAWSAAGSLLLGLNGFELSGSLEPRLAWSTGSEGRTELGGKLLVSRSLGQLVLSPGADASYSSWDSGLTSWELRPILGCSWYPGFPLSLVAEAGYRRSAASGGATLDEIPMALSLFSAIGARLLVSIDLGAYWSLDEAAFSEASASCEVSLLLAALDGGELRLPMDFDWSLDESEGWSAGLGIELALD